MTVAQGLVLPLPCARVGVAERVPGAGEAVSRAPREGEPEAVPPPPPLLLLAACEGPAEGEAGAVGEALPLVKGGVGVAMRVRSAVGVRAGEGEGVSNALSVGTGEAVPPPPPPADTLAPAVALLAALPVPTTGVSV